MFADMPRRERGSRGSSSCPATTPLRRISQAALTPGMARPARWIHWRWACSREPRVGGRKLTMSNGHARHRLRHDGRSSARSSATQDDRPGDTLVPSMARHESRRGRTVARATRPLSTALIPARSGLVDGQRNPREL